jgi:hypothetical protein
MKHANFKTNVNLSKKKKKTPKNLFILEKIEIVF